MAVTGTSFNRAGQTLDGARAVTDLSTSERRFVKISAANDDGPTVALCAAATDIPIGVLKKGANGSVTPKAVEVETDGIATFIAGAACAAGGRAQTDNQGRAIPAASTGYAVGQFLTTCTVAGEWVVVAFDCKSPQLMP